MNKPAVILVIGLPGSGKTSVASKFADFYGYPLLTSEEILAQLLSRDQLDEDRDFSPDELALTYRLMTYIADLLLEGGSGVVIDGVFRSVDQRESVFEISKKHGARVLAFEVTCEEPVLLERIQRRKQQGTVSPGGVDAYHKLAAEFEPTDNRFFRIDNT